MAPIRRLYWFHDPVNPLDGGDTNTEGWDTPAGASLYSPSLFRTPGVHRKRGRCRLVLQVLNIQARVLWPRAFESALNNRSWNGAKNAAIVRFRLPGQKYDTCMEEYIKHEFAPETIGYSDIFKS